MNKAFFGGALLCGLLGLGLSGCLGSGPTVARGPGDGLSLDGKGPCAARLCRDGKPFSGFVTENYPSGKIRWKREYRHGLKDGLHLGWWENGRKMFEYHFRKDVYHGAFREWYADGRPAKEMHYERGAEAGLQRAWRANGTLYANYEARDGRLYGVINARLCYSVKDGRGVYTAGR